MGYPAVDANKELQDLFIDYFDLLVDYLAGEPIDGNVHPIVLFALYDKIGEIVLTWRIITALRDNINEQIPSADLAALTKGTGDRFSLSFWSAGT